MGNKPAKTKICLEQASTDGDLKTVAKLMEKMGSRGRVEKEMSLIRAAESGHTDVVEYLLNKRVDPSCRVIWFNPLIGACKGKHYAVIKMLIDAGAKMDVRINDQSLLVWGCRENDHIIVDILLKGGMNPDGYHGCHDDSPLMVAISENDNYLVDLLLEAGANPNIRVKDSYPLLAACKNNNEKMVKSLLNHGADPNFDKKSSIIIHLDNLDLIKLVATKENINISNDSGTTPLSYFLSIKHKTRDIRVTDFLLQSGADPNIPDIRGDTSLIIACHYNVCGAIMLNLLDHIHDINHVNNVGETALITICKKLDMKRNWKELEFVIEKMLEKGADPCIKDKWGQIALTHLLGNRWVPPFENLYRLLLSYDDDMINNKFITLCMRRELEKLKKMSRDTPNLKRAKGGN